MTLWLWTGFIALVLGLLALDLGVFNRKAHAISTREALGWTVFWVCLALLFNALVYVMYDEHWLGIGVEVGHQLSGRDAALAFFTAYVVEKSLSLDNIFVIAMIFAYFQVPAKYQHRVLFWGVLGALIMRGVMIGAGIAVLQRFAWLFYVFGALLIATAVKMLVARADTLEPEKSPLVRAIRHFYPVTEKFHEERFFVRQAGRWAATPLFLALIIIESSDLLFAVDSIPAVFAVTLDPFIVFTSNVFAILGLRSLYFALAAMMDRFQYMKVSLVFILVFVGVKMLLIHHYPVAGVVSLSVIVGILLVGVMASVLATPEAEGRVASPLGKDLGALSRVSEHTVHRVFVLIACSTVLVLLGALLVARAFAALILPLALLTLGTEFIWARAWLDRVRTRTGTSADVPCPDDAGAQAPGDSASSASRSSRSSISTSLDAGA